ncbi:hypothetical protein ACFPH8_09115 [Bizionia hallyeonensis]|uniref:Uncharacterized protein n=1 Tax=Bizionia hallyeonensis TaxID=1123757 RepID=A0ABW0C7B6_9FLAO
MEFIQNLKMLNKYEIGEKYVIKLTNGLRFVSVVKQLKAAVQDSGGWPSAAVAIHRIRFLCSFQENEKYLNPTDFRNSKLQNKRNHQVSREL